MRLHLQFSGRVWTCRMGVVQSIHNEVHHNVGGFRSRRRVVVFHPQPSRLGLHRMGLKKTVCLRRSVPGQSESLKAGRAGEDERGFKIP
jgi:hypothetical protein